CAPISTATNRTNWARPSPSAVPPTPRSSGIDRLREPVGPSLGAMQDRDDLNNIIFDSVRNYVRRAGDHQPSRSFHSTRSSERRKFAQALHRRSDALDCTCRRGWVVLGNSLTHIVETPEIAGRVINPARHQRGCKSRLYSSSASSCETISPRSNSAIPASISAICHSLRSTYVAIASAARYDFDRLVARNSASSLAFSTHRIDPRGHDRRVCYAHGALHLGMRMAPHWSILTR